MVVDRISETLEPLVETRRQRRITLLLRSVALVVAFLWLVGHHELAWILPGALVAGVVLCDVSSVPRRDTAQVVVAVALSVAAANYILWRLTVLNWTAAFIGIPLFLAELHACLQALGLQVTLWPREGFRPTPTLDVDELPIFVLVPTVNEGRAIVEGTLRAVLDAVHAYQFLNPRAIIRTVVCNDGFVAGAACSPDIEALAAELGVECITRVLPGGAKAGNLEAARQALPIPANALIAIFDADQEPRWDFFLQTLPQMADHRIGWVQTGQYYRNRENLVARWADEQQSFFYRSLCPGKAKSDAAFICGTNVVIRAEALADIGGFPQNSVTEDFAASIKLAARWRSLYLTEVLATGLGPVTLQAYLRQQSRWARGTLTVLRSSWKTIFLPSRRGLSIPQRVQYGLAATHYLSGLRDLIFLAAPICFVLTGVTGVKGATLVGFLAHAVPYYLLSLIAFRMAARGATTWRSVVMGFVSFPVLVSAALHALFGYEGHFTITPKARGAVTRSTRVHRLALGLCLLALCTASLLRGGGAALIAQIWLGYLAFLLVIAVALDEADVRGLDSIWGLLPLRPAMTAVIRARHQIAKKSRVMVTLALVFSMLAAGITLAEFLTRSSPVVAAAPRGTPPTPYGGLSGIGPAAAPRLLSLVRPQQGILGETEEIGAGLNQRWVLAAARTHSVLWITLSFSEDGKAILGSSLTAITNGMDDVALTRDATQLAAYGRPVYLTLFPEVDRNYPVTSAVARGGIPQDVGPAWAHVQKIFAEAGARNVAWVWQPANPDEDAAFLPPSSRYDAVAVTLFEYAHTKWVNPAYQLADAAAKHPGKPLLVDVSAAGAPSEPMSLDDTSSSSAKVAWIEATQRAIAARSDVAAVLYADSGPLADPSSSAARPWSLSSSEGSIRAVSNLVSYPGVIFHADWIKWPR